MTAILPMSAARLQPMQMTRATRHALGLHVKRSFDVAGAVAGLALFWPLLLLLALLVRFGPHGGPILFAHTRIGREGKEFRCYKFRTMRVDGDQVLACHLASNASVRREWEETHKLRDDPRVTAVGHVLRKFSLDELPQLLNVLLGDMSLVGPRPIVRSELLRYGRSSASYLGARPGLTGLWQINGRNDVSYRKRVAYDRFYARHWSIAGDLVIIAKTIPVVCLARGSY